MRSEQRHYGPPARRVKQAAVGPWSGNDDQLAGYDARTDADAHEVDPASHARSRGAAEVPIRAGPSRVSDACGERGDASARWVVDRHVQIRSLPIGRYGPHDVRRGLG